MNTHISISEFYAGPKTRKITDAAIIIINLLYCLQPEIQIKVWPGRRRCTSHSRRSWWSQCRWGQAPPGCNRLETHITTPPWCRSESPDTQTSPTHRGIYYSLFYLNNFVLSFINGSSYSSLVVDAVNACSARLFRNYRETRSLSPLTPGRCWPVTSWPPCRGRWTARWRRVRTSCRWSSPSPGRWSSRQRQSSWPSGHRPG